MNEQLYICQPDGMTAFKCTRVPTDAELELIGFVRVQFKDVWLRPRVCPVNGAEFGDEPYKVRLPHRPDGQRIRFS